MYLTNVTQATECPCLEKYDCCYGVCIPIGKRCCEDLNNCPEIPDGHNDSQKQISDLNFK